MMAFAWPEVGHPIINAVSAAPPDEDYSVPRNPRAAIFHGQIAPGALNVTPAPSRPPRNYRPADLGEP